MKRRTLLCLAVLACLSLSGALGQERPLVVQPNEAGYSAAELTALGEAVVQLERLLRNADLASQRMLGQTGWDALDFAAYTAGTLERLGYGTTIVRQGDGAGERAWALVRVGFSGKTAWVPVEPVADPVRRQLTLGAVPVVSRVPLRFDPHYLSYDEVVLLPANLPPTADIRPVAHVIVSSATAFFGHLSADPDGEIVLYQWTFPDRGPTTLASSSIWHTFAGIGKYAVALTVTDSRGAQASTTLNVEVVEETPCGCGGK